MFPQASVSFLNSCVREARCAGAAAPLGLVPAAQRTAGTQLRPVPGCPPLPSPAHPAAAAPPLHRGTWRPLPTESDPESTSRPTFPLLLHCLLQCRPPPWGQSEHLPHCSLLSSQPPSAGVAKPRCLCDRQGVGVGGGECTGFTRSFSTCCQMPRS